MVSVMIDYQPYLIGGRGKGEGKGERGKCTRVLLSSIGTTLRKMSRRDSLYAGCYVKKTLTSDMQDKTCKPFFSDII